MNQASIFDLDGTLTDTLDSLVYLVNLMLSSLNLPKISREQCRQFVGNGAKVLVEKALRASGDVDLKLFDGAMKIYGEVFGENCTYHVRPYEGILKLLEELKKRGVRTAVLSNKPHDQAVDVVHSFFEEGCFDLVLGQCEGRPRKPDPAGIYLAAEQLLVSPKNCLYIGDSEVDIKTGIAAGVKTIGVTWGFRERETLVEAGAKYLADKPEDILMYMEEK